MIIFDIEQKRRLWIRKTAEDRILIEICDENYNALSSMVTNEKELELWLDLVILTFALQTN